MASIATMTTHTRHHEPACGNFRKALAMLRNSGVEPEPIEHLKPPATRATLVALIAARGAPVTPPVR